MYGNAWKGNKEELNLHMCLGCFCLFVCFSFCSEQCLKQKGIKEKEQMI